MKSPINHDMLFCAAGVVYVDDLIVVAYVDDLIVAKHNKYC